MAKYQILVTANGKHDIITIHHRFVSINIMNREDRFLSILKVILPRIDWQLDDGEDCKGSNYCQYVCYTDDSKDSCLLASWNEIDEKTGCIKL